MKRVPVVTLAVLIAVQLASGFAAANEHPSNRVVVLVDASLSFRSRSQEAVQATTALLDTMARTRLHRWEVSADSIAVISLDALPEVIWQGTLRDLKNADPAVWQQRFLARRDFSKCTDVGAGFGLAVRLLQGDPRLVHKYLFAFTDLVDEPPAGSVGTCRPAKRPCPPPVGFPWESLRDVSVSVFWVPADEKLEWHRVVAAKGMDETFHLFSTRESGAAVITPPPTARLTTTETDRQERKNQVGAFGVQALKLIVLVVLLGALALGALLIVARRRTAVRPSAGRAPQRPAMPTAPRRGSDPTNP